MKNVLVLTYYIIDVSKLYLFAALKRINVATHIGCTAPAIIKMKYKPKGSLSSHDAFAKGFWLKLPSKVPSLF